MDLHKALSEEEMNAKNKENRHLVLSRWSDKGQNVRRPARPILHSVKINIINSFIHSVVYLSVYKKKALK